MSKSKRPFKGVNGTRYVAFTETGEPIIFGDVGESQEDVLARARDAYPDDRIIYFARVVLTNDPAQWRVV